MKPQCSVIVPTYNRKESLRRTLEGLERQTMSSQEFEVVVVSDGSTDGTVELLESYSRDSELSLRWFQQQNQGPAAARNRGVREAAADIVVLLDDDVVPIPEFLERHMRCHEGVEDVVVIGPMLPDPKWACREPVWIAWEHANLQKIYEVFLPGGEHDHGYMAPMHFYSGNASLRRRWLIDTGGFNEEFKRQEDVEFAERLHSRSGVSFRFMPDVIGLHHPSRSWASWLKIPSAYGKLDAVRVKNGTLPEDRVLANASNRHGATRQLTALCTLLPGLIGFTSFTAGALSVAMYAISLKTISFRLLSAIYNAQYMVAFDQGMRQSLGGQSAAAK